jgi:cytidine deaminase
MGWRHLEEAARAAKLRAYCPYSKYPVGAAIYDEESRLFSGTNVENVSFGATLCAERSAVSQMILQGGREIRQLAVATEDGGFPCGICLQVLAEFRPRAGLMEIALLNDAGRKLFTLDELFPFAFVSLGHDS